MPPVIAIDHYAGFHGASVALLVAAATAGVLWVTAFAVRYVASFPKQPAAGPETSELGPEPPAVANLLVNRWHLTRVAAPATLVDLAARRVLGLEEVGPDRFVLRVRNGRDPEPDGGLAPYEDAVLDLVRAQATGGSAPVAAIDLGDTEAAERWWKDFTRSVVTDARARGLARNRWTPVDWVVLGVLAALTFGLLAGALEAAHVGAARGAHGTDPGDWLAFGAFAWVVAMLGLARLRSVRDTPAGRAAAARWLGVRAHLRSDPSFADAPPAAVAIWGRSLAYGVALGVARGATRSLPLGAEDPDTAWSRYGGTWHQIRVEYPHRFGYGASPVGVFAGGILRVLWWGGLALVVLPIVIGQAWGAAERLVPPATSTAELGVIAAFVAVFGVMGVYLVVQLVDGLVRVARSGADLGRTVEVVGAVIKAGDAEHPGYVALDDGRSPTARAWLAPSGAPALARGAVVRAVMSPHLRHVRSITLS